MKQLKSIYANIARNSSSFVIDRMWTVYILLLGVMLFRWSWLYTFHSCLNITCDVYFWALYHQFDQINVIMLHLAILMRTTNLLVKRNLFYYCLNKKITNMNDVTRTSSKKEFWHMEKSKMKISKWFERNLCIYLKLLINRTTWN